MSKNAAALTEKTLPDNVATLIDIILEENPMHTSFIDGALKHVSDEAHAPLDKYLDFCQSKLQNLPYMAD